MRWMIVVSLLTLVLGCGDSSGDDGSDGGAPDGGAGLTPGPIIEITSREATPSGSQLGTCGGTLYATWIESGNLYFSRSVDSGVGWSEPLRLDGDGGPNETGLGDVHIRCNGEAVFVLWNDEREIPSTAYRIARSLDRGETWVALDEEVVEARSRQQASLVSVGDSHYLAYFRGVAAGKVSPSFVKSVDGGAVWTQPIELAPGVQGPLGQEAPGMALVEGALYFGWLRDDAGGTVLAVHHSGDTGDTWDASPIGFGPAGSNASALTDCEGQAHLIWGDLADSFFYQTLDDGAAVGTPTVLLSSRPALSRMLCLQGAPAIALMTLGDTGSEIAFLAPAEAGGFAELQRIDGGEAGGIFPAAAAFGEAVAVAWAAGSAQSRLLLATSPDRGLTFDSPMVLDDDFRGDQVPQMVASEAGIWVIWSNATDNTVRATLLH